MISHREMAEDHQAELSRTKGPEPKRPPEMVHNKILARIHEALKPILEEFAEPAGFVVTIPWNFGQESFPFGTVVVRDNEPFPPEITLAAVDQSRKMLGYMVGTFSNYVATGNEFLQSLEREIHERQQILQEPEGGEARPAADGHARPGPG